MQIDKVLAGVAVADWARARDWYEVLMSRPADAVPMEGLAEWHTAGGVLQVVADRERAGGSLVTLWVPDIRAALSEVASRAGLHVEPDDTTSDKVIFATLTDLDRNAITLVQVRDGAELRGPARNQQEADDDA
ncbi:MAG: VOC family protein [Jiangellaceae bacterium]